MQVLTTALSAPRLPIGRRLRTPRAMCCIVRWISILSGRRPARLRPTLRAPRPSRCPKYMRISPRRRCSRWSTAQAPRSRTTRRSGERGLTRYASRAHLARISRPSARLRTSSKCAGECMLMTHADLIWQVHLASQLTNSYLEQVCRRVHANDACRPNLAGAPRVPVDEFVPRASVPASAC